MNIDFTLICHGAILTIILTLASLIIGLIAACAVTYAGLSTLKTIQKITLGYTAVIRGTPVLLQLFFVYYGLGQSTFIQQSLLWLLFKSAIVCGIITLSNNSMAYVSNLLLGAINKMPKAQLQAAHLFGLSNFSIYISIQLPYALKSIFPYYKNELIMLMKATSLMSTITVLELTGSINQIVSLNYQNLAWYSISALIYLIISIGITQLCRLAPVMT